MTVEMRMNLDMPYFWEHPSYAVRATLLASRVGGHWIITHDDVRHVTKCQLQFIDAGFEVSDYVVNDSLFMGEAVKQLAQRTLMRSRERQA